MRNYIVLIVLALFVSNPLVSKAQTFSDVTKSHWSYDAVQFAVDQQLVSGYGDQTFRPNKALTEGHFVKMFANLLYKEDVQKAEKQFQSEMKNNAYAAYYNVLKKKGYVWMDGSKVNEHISRYDVSQFILRAVTGVNNTGEVAFELLKGLHITTTANYEQFNPWGNLTRAQAAGFLHRLYTNYLMVEIDLEQQEPTIETIQLTNTIQLNYAASGTFYVYDGNELTTKIYSQQGQQVGDVVVGQPLEHEGLHCPYNMKFSAYNSSTLTCQTTPLLKYIYYTDHLGGKVLFAVEQFKNSANALFDFYTHVDALHVEAVKQLNVKLTNLTRAKYGMHPVQLNEHLSTVAQYHADDMALFNYYEHENRQGQSPSDRAAMMSYHHPYVAEIIFKSPKNMFEAHAGWMNSLGHRSILISKNYYVIGSGIAAQYDQAGHVSAMYYVDNFSRE